MTLNAWLDNWQRCSHTSDTSWDIHSYLKISASYENVAKVRDLIRSDWRVTVRMIRSLNDLEKGFVVSSQSLRTLGCCITIMLSVTLPSLWKTIWPKKVFQWFHSHHTRLIWVHVTSSSSQDSNSTSKVVILKLWTTSMKTSNTATGSGSNVSSGVWLPKGTNLKWMMLIFSSYVNKKNYSTSRITF
jgi:hypothetical protein